MNSLETFSSNSAFSTALETANLIANNDTAPCDDFVVIHGGFRDLNSPQGVKICIEALGRTAYAGVLFSNCRFDEFGFDVWGSLIDALNAQNTIVNLRFEPFVLDQYRVEALANVRGLKQLGFRQVPTDKWQGLCSGLRKFKDSTLDSLSIDFSELEDVQFADLCVALRDGPSLSRLDLGSNQLEMGKGCVANLLEAQPRLQEIDLKQNPLNPFMVIQESLLVASNLSRIDLSDTTLSEADQEMFLTAFAGNLEIFRQARSKCPPLKVILRIKEADSRLQDIAIHISSNWSDLLRLDIGTIIPKKPSANPLTLRNLLENTEEKEVAWFQTQWESTLHNPTYFEDHFCILRGNGIVPKSKNALKGLVAALEQLDCRALEFSAFNFAATNVKVWTALVASLSECSRIKLLCFSESVIDDIQLDSLQILSHLQNLSFITGIKADMFPALKALRWTELHTLELSDCKISDQQLPSLLEAVQWISSLRTLNLSGNKLTKKSFEFFLQLKDLTTVILDRNNGIDLDLVFRLLQFLPRLESLSLLGISFEEKDLINFAKSLDSPLLREKIKKQRNGFPLKLRMDFSKGQKSSLEKLQQSADVVILESAN